MNRNELHSQIQLLIERMAAGNTALKNQEGKFSQLETDLLRKQCIELYDAINQLHLANIMHKADSIVSEKNLEVIKIKENIISNSIEITDLVAEKVDIMSEVKPKKDEEFIDNSDKEDNKEAPIVEFEENIIKAKSDTPKFIPIIEKTTQETLSVTKQPMETSKSVLEKINEANTDKTLHESITPKNEENELSHRFANSKIAKIKDAIDISKRFEIQSNLFRADSNTYNISISELEIAENKADALEIFNRFAARYHWNMDDNLVQELKSFIYRKF